jgi:hypothetical protein
MLSWRGRLLIHVFERQARQGAVQEGHIVYPTYEDTGINVLRQRL